MERSAAEAAGAAARLLTRLKDALAFEDHNKDGARAELPTKVWTEHAVNTRKTQKLLFWQLQVVKFLLDFLDSAPGFQDASCSGVRNEMAEAKQQWKALKAEYQDKVEAIREAVPQTLARLEEARCKAKLLEEVLGRYRTKVSFRVSVLFLPAALGAPVPAIPHGRFWSHGGTYVEHLKKDTKKKQEMEEKVKNAQERHLEEQERLRKLCEQMEGRVVEKQGRLQRYQEELQRLQGELEEQELQAGDWRQKAQTISDLQCFLETLQGVKLTHVSETDLELELTSRSQPGTAQPHSLKLGLHWREDGNISLQCDCPFVPLSVALPVGTSGTIKDILLELQDSYLQQAQLLAEIESLHSRFAIDWQPEKRLLHYLKPSFTCTLCVEPGYPTSGGIRLLSIKSQHGAVDVAVVRPSQETPSLQDWLEYLSAVDFSAPFLARGAV
ncbi:ZW10 interactor-like isoform X1 [Sphaerodactylus townsendi]|uniref:ZW10 interactor-like isoform X1 n=1 Tax=Sphaerodactylus townsendi TaxID=933632 RepID=UPI002026F0F3|nr:ZW10 interactor-like isoform X1 [Sphaerodactylus townsendi]